MTSLVGLGLQERLWAARRLAAAISIQADHYARTPRMSAADTDRFAALRRQLADLEIMLMIIGAQMQRDRDAGDYRAEDPQRREAPVLRDPVSRRRYPKPERRDR